MPVQIPQHDHAVIRGLAHQLIHSKPNLSRFSGTTHESGGPDLRTQIFVGRRERPARKREQFRLEMARDEMHTDDAGEHGDAGSATAHAVDRSHIASVI